MTVSLFLLHFEIVWNVLTEENNVFPKSFYPDNETNTNFFVEMVNFKKVTHSTKKKFFFDMT